MLLILSQVFRLVICLCICQTSVILRLRILYFRISCLMYHLMLCLKRLLICLMMIYWRCLVILVRLVKIMCLVCSLRLLISSLLLMNGKSLLFPRIVFQSNILNNIYDYDLVLRQSEALLEVLLIWLCNPKKSIYEINISRSDYSPTLI